MRTEFELIIPFYHSISSENCSMLNTAFRNTVFPQTPQLEGTALLDENTTPLQGVYTLSQTARRTIGLHSNEGHAYTLVKGNTGFYIGKLKLWLFKSEIGFVTVHISTNELNEAQVLDLVSELCNIQQKTKISYVQSISKDISETRVLTLKDVINKLFALIGDENCSPIDTATYKKAFCLFYGTGSASSEDEMYTFLEMLRNQNKSSRMIAEYNAEAFFRPFKYINWAVSAKVVAAFCDIVVAGKANEQFLTAPGGLVQSVFTNYLLLYLNLLSTNLKLNLLERKYNLTELYKNNQCTQEARKDISLYLNFPVVNLSNEPHIDTLFDKYLYDKTLELKNKRSQFSEVCAASAITLEDLHEDLEDVKKQMKNIEQQINEWMNSVTSLVSQRKSEFATQSNTAPEILEEQRSVFINSVAAEIAKLACNNAAPVNAEENKLKEMFGIYWDKLDEFTRKALVSARVFLVNSGSVSYGGLDYSGVCISACSALEQELKLRFFTGYKEYLRQKFNDDYSRWPNSMRYSYGNGKYTENKTFTIGRMPAIFGSKQRHEKTGERFDNNNMSVTVREKALLNEYIRTIMTADATDVQAFFQTDETGLSFLDRCEDVRCMYRNAAAHTESLSVETANKCCRDVIGIGGSVADKTVGQVQGLIYDLVRLTDSYNSGRNRKWK